MYLQILKKDLKRKKTMNCILLLFVILSAMFAASSVNNIVAVSNGLDYYFEKAGMSDYFIIATEPDGEGTMAKTLDRADFVTDYKRENAVICTADNFTKDGKRLADFSNAAMAMPIGEAKLNYFDKDDNIIDSVASGEAYMSGSIVKKAGLEIGDTFEYKIGETEFTLTYAGPAKDAFMGSEMMGNPRILLNNGDFEKILADSSASAMIVGFYYINTSDLSALEAAVTEINGIMFDSSLSAVKMTYVMNMLVAGMLLVVSVCLIIVSFVVLRFTISFTVAEEFREIGVMKAVGIKNSSIRGLYLVKYLGIAIAGAVIGYIGSVPFGKMLLSSVSENMVLGNENSFIIGVLCCIAVVGIILLFCWLSTGKIKRLSPIDAVRSGQTGERFRKKSLLHLGKSRLGTTGFLSFNDVLSSSKQYGIITAVFAICILLVTVLANVANTLNSESLLFLFGVTKSDVYYSTSSCIMEVVGGTKPLDEALSEIETTLSENGMPGKAHFEALYPIPVAYGDTKRTVSFQQCKDTKANDYTYTEGSAPQYENEIALTYPVAEKLGAGIGDTVTLNIDGEERDYIITALFQSFNSLGEAGRLHESVSIADTSMSGGLAIQIDFDDHPNDKEIDRRIEKLRDIFEADNIYNAREYSRRSTGAADIISGVKNLVLIISLIIIIMISVLMERSFITKEKSEIALMKAVGFKSRSVIAQHTARFAIISVISAVVAIALCAPLTKLIADPIFGMLGAVSGVSYEIQPFEIFAVYPLAVMAATVIGTFFAALYTRSIKASDTSDIE